MSTHSIDAYRRNYGRGIISEKRYYTYFIQFSRENIKTNFSFQRKYQNLVNEWMLNIHRNATFHVWRWFFKFKLTVRFNVQLSVDPSSRTYPMDTIRAYSRKSKLKMGHIKSNCIMAHIPNTKDQSMHNNNQHFFNISLHIFTLHFTSRVRIQRSSIQFNGLAAVENCDNIDASAGIFVWVDDFVEEKLRSRLSCANIYFSGTRRMNANTHTHTDKFAVTKRETSSINVSSQSVSTQRTAWVLHQNRAYDTIWNFKTYHSTLNSEYWILYTEIQTQCSIPSAKLL